jgi:hypothetical protein
VERVVERVLLLMIEEELRDERGRGGRELRAISDEADGTAISHHDRQSTSAKGKKGRREKGVQRQETREREGRLTEQRK